MVLPDYAGINAQFAMRKVLQNLPFQKNSKSPNFPKLRLFYFHKIL